MAKVVGAGKVIRRLQLNPNLRVLPEPVHDALKQLNLLPEWDELDEVHFRLGQELDGNGHDASSNSAGRFSLAGLGPGKHVRGTDARLASGLLPHLRQRRTTRSQEAELGTQLGVF